MSETPRPVARWRLVLGRAAEQRGLDLGGDPELQRIEELVGFLFDEGKPSANERGGGGEASRLTVPAWIDGVTELFPRQAAEVMERELVRRRGVLELLQQPELLEKVEPSVELAKTILTHQGLLTEETRVLARKVIAKVVEELKATLKVQVEQALSGALRRDRHSPRRVWRNLDLRTTLRRNLRHYDPRGERLLVEKVYYHAAERRQRPWHVIVAVDQSGSMLHSAIFAAVMASIFHELPALSTSLFLFDTQVVDLTGLVGQPVDVLLRVQLGGGTDIGQALGYAGQLVRQPARTIVVLVTDFFEGGDEGRLVQAAADLTQAGVRLIGLAALGLDARPAYNRNTARKLRRVGMDVLACTPDKLAACMARIIRV